MRLSELQTTVGGAPPVLTDPGDGDGPRGGEYWLHGSTKIKIDGDFATMVYRHSHEFGLSEDQLIQRIHRLANDERLATAIERSVHEWLERERTNGHKSAFEQSYVAGFLGGRTVGANILLEIGWSFVTYEVHRMRVWATTKHLQEIVYSLAKVFPLMQIEELDMMVMKGLWTVTPGGQTTVKFRRDDFPGVAGMFKTVMHWARTGEAPQQAWLYVTVRPEDLDTVRTHGLVAEGPTHFYVGNWTERNVYKINYMPESNFTRARYAKGISVRFVPEARPAGTETKRDDMAHAMALFSKQPFTIPPDALQIKNGGYWQPLGR